MKNVLARISIAIMLVNMLGCAPTSPKEDVDRYGCVRPEHSRFPDEYTVNLASLNFKDLQAGGFEFTKTPRMFNVLSEGSKDNLATDYITCLAKRRDGLSNSQKEWLRNQLNFFRTGPNPSDADDWLTNHPMPSVEGSSQGDYGRQSIKTVGPKSDIQINRNGPNIISY